MTDPAPRKRCFVVGPIGSDDSDDRIHADWLLEMIIAPVFAESFPDFDVLRSDRIANPGRIDEQMITELLTADLVIADLTTLNPNAFYEIGIRHTIQKPIIHMHLEGERIPFDIASFRSIKFSRKWPRDLDAAKLQLKEFASQATSPHHIIDNPVTYSRGKVEFREKATPSDRILQDQISDLGRRLASLEKGGFRWPQNNLQDTEDSDVKIIVRWSQPTDHNEAQAILHEVIKNYKIREWTSRQSNLIQTTIYLPSEFADDFVVAQIQKQLMENSRIHSAIRSGR